MGLFALDIILWLLGVRGHIPQFDDFRPAPAAPSASPGTIARTVVAIVAVVAALVLALWATVRLAIELF